MPDFDPADVLPDRPKEERPKPILRALRVFLVGAVGLVGLFLAVVAAYLLGVVPGFRTYRITADSMAPTLVPEEHIVADMRYFQNHPPTRGDVVVFRFLSSTGDAMLTKRVVGLAGDVISGAPGLLVVNGQAAREPYVKAELEDLPYDARETFGPLVVPPNQVFLMGDNRQRSYDSRYYGPVPVGQLKGKVLYISWSKELRRIGKRVE